MGQDTLSVLHYNLLNYRNVTTYCTSNNNNTANKEAALKEIIQYSKPDIFTCNEIGNDYKNAAYLLENSLNQNGITYYETASFSNSLNSPLTNMLFFNSQKLRLYQQSAITKKVSVGNLLRQVDVYYLQFLPSASVKSEDSVKIKVYVTHFKAGDNSSNRANRSETAMANMQPYHTDVFMMERGRGGGRG